MTYRSGPGDPGRSPGEPRDAAAAEERLRRSEARYRALVEARTSIVWTADATGLIIGVPTGWEALTGQPPEQARGAGWMDVLHADDRGPAAREWTRAVRERRVHVTEFRLRHADGSHHWYRARGVPVCDDAGRVREWVGVLEDIDAERRDEAARDFLERASDVLGRTLDPRSTLRAVAQLAIEPQPASGVAFADGVAIDLPRPGGGFDRATVVSRDPARRDLVDDIERLYPTPPDAPAGYAAAIRTGEPQLHPEMDASVLPGLARDARHLEMLRALDMYSSIVVPLRSRGQTLGAITFVLHGPERRRPYDRRDLAVAMELARRAGAALDNAARYEAERVAARHAERLLAVANGLGEAVTEEEVADVIFREGLSALGAAAGSLGLVRGDPTAGGELEIVRTTGFAEELVERYHRFPIVPGGPLSDALLGREPVLVRSRADWLARYPRVAPDTAGLGYEAMVAVPVVAGGRVLAGIVLSFRDPREFDEGTRTFLATLGEQCALALERARLFASEQRRRRTSAFLAEASRLLGASLDYEATLKAVAAAAVPRLGDWCAVDIVADPTGGQWPPTLERLAVVHQDPEKLRLAASLTSRYPTDWSAPGGMAAVLRDRVPMFVPVVTDEMLVAGARDAEHLALVRAVGFASIIVVPLVARDLTLGALTLVTSESRRHYDEGDLALADDLARRAAVAVDNARLYREAQRARDEAQQANRAKSEFLATMSHELRTPLNAIAGYVELLGMGLRGPVTDAQREDLERIRRSQRHLLGLIEDVLSFARIEAGRVELAFERVRASEVLEGLEVLVAPQLRAKGLAWELRRAEPSPVVVADRDKLQQVLLNLVSNAIKATAPGGRITLSCTEQATTPRRVCFAVTDAGVGIPADKLEVIFEPFVQLEGGLTRSREGTGLGLAISRDLARRMGGDVTVESMPGVGSTFALTLLAADGVGEERAGE